MPHRKIAADQIAQLLHCLAHPDRVRIVMELQTGEREVCSLKDSLQISASRLSQHLGLLKSERIAKERKEGRRVLYRLASQGLAEWLMESKQFIFSEKDRVDHLVAAMEIASESWKKTDSPEDR